MASLPWNALILKEAYPVWQSVPSMTKRRFGVGVGVVDNLLYAIGGWDGKHSSSVERYYAFSKLP
ncbi:kelch repeat protein [Cooperia oncophora]